MARSQRLLDLIQLLRGYRYAVKGEVLARELGVSLRTLYRDIATLQAQGAPIEGEAGVGYVLRPGFVLPPLMFSVEEIEALVLGVRWVSTRADASLALAARKLVAKIQAVVPAPLRRELESTTLMVGPPASQAPFADELAVALRGAIRDERKLWINYQSDGKTSERTIWPFALGYFESVLVVLAWCELRQGLRHFRADRIAAWQVTTEPYPEGRGTLLDKWRVSEGLGRDELVL